MPRMETRDHPFLARLPAFSGSTCAHPTSTQTSGPPLSCLADRALGSTRCSTCIAREPGTTPFLRGWPWSRGLPLPPKSRPKTWDHPFLARLMAFPGEHHLRPVPTQYRGPTLSCPADRVPGAHDPRRASDENLGPPLYCPAACVFGITLSAPSLDPDPGTNSSLPGGPGARERSTLTLYYPRTWDHPFLTLVTMFTWTTRPDPVNELSTEMLHIQSY